MTSAAATLERPSTAQAHTSSAAETDKRRQILGGARTVFRASGFDGASMGEIAKAASVSKGTLYVYFDSKEALFEALILEEKCGLAEALFRLDADDPDTRGVLTRLGWSYVTEFSRPGQVEMIRMVVGAVEKLPRFGQFFHAAGPAQGVARLSAYLDTQVDAGRLDIEDTALAARHFLDLCQAGLVPRLLFGAGGPATPAERDRWVSEAVRVFMAGYGKKSGTTD